MALLALCLFVSPTRNGVLWKLPFLVPFSIRCWELQWEGENLGALIGVPGMGRQDLLAPRRLFGGGQVWFE